MKYRWVVTYISNQYRSSFKEISISIIADAPFEAIACFHRAVTSNVEAIIRLERKEQLL